MKFTGERLHSDVNEFWAAEHYHRYLIASQFVAEKKVLDIASGEGYGSFFLAGNAAEVTGVDISTEAVDFARKVYKRSNLNYKHGSADRIPLDDNSVDVVVSFETIEHHDKHMEMMSEIKRVLKADGTLVISSPDKKNYSDIPQYSNPYHVKELYRDEFETLIGRHFKECYFLSQKTVFGSLITGNSRISENQRLVEYWGSIKDVHKSLEMSNPVYNLAICSDTKLSTDISITSFYHSERDWKVVESELLEQIREHKALLADIYSNKSFKLGNLISSPYRYFRKLFK